MSSLVAPSESSRKPVAQRRRRRPASLRKVYRVTLKSRGDKVIYVDSLSRKKAVEAADQALVTGTR